RSATSRDGLRIFAGRPLDRQRRRCGRGLVRAAAATSPLGDLRRLGDIRGGVDRRAVSPLSVPQQFWATSGAGGVIARSLRFTGHQLPVNWNADSDTMTVMAFRPRIRLRWYALGVVAGMVAAIATYWWLDGPRWRNVGPGSGHTPHFSRD